MCLGCVWAGREAVSQGEHTLTCTVHCSGSPPSSRVPREQPHVFRLKGNNPTACMGIAFYDHKIFPGYLLLLKTVLRRL